MNENLGGNLDIYKNMACLTLDGDDCYGSVHPRDAMLPEIVLLVCARIQKELAKGNLKKQENELLCMTPDEFADIILSCRKEWGGGWSKEYREMDKERLVENVTEYMKNWMMVKKGETQVTVFPAVGRAAGYYPDDFKGGTRE